MAPQNMHLDCSMLLVLKYSFSKKNRSTITYFANYCWGSNIFLFFNYKNSDGNYFAFLLPRSQISSLLGRAQEKE